MNSWVGANQKSNLLSRTGERIMKLSELIKEASLVLKERGDMDILISISNKDSKPLPEQNYVISEPNTMICEENEDTGFEFWIRDWPY